MNNTFLMMFSGKELIVFGAVVVVILFAVVIGMIISGKNKKKDLESAEEEADFFCELYYYRHMKEAEMKYKAYKTRGYYDKLPNPIEAIGKDKQMQDLLNQTDSLIKRKTILEDYLPNIMLALIRCKAEGMDTISGKEAVQLKKLMKEYGVKTSIEK